LLHMWYLNAPSKCKCVYIYRERVPFILHYVKIHFKNQGYIIWDVINVVQFQETRKNPNRLVRWFLGFITMVLKRTKELLLIYKQNFPKKWRNIIAYSLSIHSGKPLICLRFLKKLGLNVLLFKFFKQLE
jgi:hypothetical protein